MLIIIYVDDILIIGQTRKEVESTRDTLIYLLQQLEFLLNLKKSVLHLCQVIEFLGIIVNSVNLTLSHPLQKVQKVHKECTKMCNKNWTLILELINVLGLLAIKLALLTFTKLGSIISTNFQIDNKTAIPYLLKMGGTTNQTMIALSKEIWEVLLKKT